MLTVHKEIFRPKDIPITVPNCGWNHGEIENNKKNKSTPTSKDGIGMINFLYQIKKIIFNFD